MMGSSVCFSVAAPPTRLIGHTQNIRHGIIVRDDGNTTCNRSNMRMQQQSLGKVSLYCGIGVLAGVLGNRLLLTPLDSLAMTQSRSDILGVITGATLLLYGVGKAEIADRKAAVTLDGVKLRQGFRGDDSSREVEWAAAAVMAGIPNVRSFCIVMDGREPYLSGLFRNEQVEVNVVDGGVVDIAMRYGKRAYLADLKVVPVKEVEFGFLPSKCQAALVVPIGKRAAMIIGADKPRPLTRDDFDWIQAIADRLLETL